MAAALLVISLLALPIFAAPCCAPQKAPSTSATHGCCGPTCEMKKSSDSPRSHLQSTAAATATPSVPQLVCTIVIPAPQSSAASLRDSLNAVNSAQDHESAYLTNLQLLI